MKFGSVDNPQNIDFAFPNDHPDTKKVLNKVKDDNLPEIFLGCAKWNRADLKGFYPRGTKDELAYDKTPKGFKFFPKLNQENSNWKRLNETKSVVEDYLNNTSNLKKIMNCFFTNEY